MEVIGITLLVTQFLYQMRSQKSGVCMIVVEQDDAQIYLDDRLIKSPSPAFIPIQLNRTHHVVIRKLGYEDHHVDLVSRQKTTYYYANLEPIKLHLIH